MKLIKEHDAQDKEPSQKDQGSEVACKSSQDRDKADDDSWHDSEKCDARGDAEMFLENHDRRKTTVVVEEPWHYATSCTMCPRVEMHEVNKAQSERNDDRGVSLEDDHARSMPAWQRFTFQRDWCWRRLWWRTTFDVRQNVKPPRLDRQSKTVKGKGKQKQDNNGEGTGGDKLHNGI